MRGLLSPLIKLVVFLIVTSVATYVLGATIANTSFGSTESYHADFSDASGLEIGDDVRIAGVRVGTVSNIQIAPDHNTADVTFSVQKSRPLPRSVHVNLRYRNLVGERYLDVEQGTGSSRILEPGATIPERQTSPAVDLTVLFDGFQPLFQGLDADQINQLSGEIIQTLQGESGSLDSLLSTVADLTNSVADKDRTIGEVIDNLAQVLTTVGDRDTELSNLIVQLQGFVSGLAQDRTTIGDAIGGIDTLATQTAGLLGQLRPPLKTDVTDLTGLLGVLNKNSADLQYVIQQLPLTIGPLIRTASYGSWFNFYLCDLSTTLTLPGGKQVDATPSHSQQARCQ